MKTIVRKFKDVSLDERTSILNMMYDNEMQIIAFTLLSDIELERNDYFDQLFLIIKNQYNRRNRKTLKEAREFMVKYHNLLKSTNK